jgi:uncharacterized repeat protein (TIGR03803 family)
MTQQKCSPSLIRLGLLLAVALALAIPASAQWKEQVLYSFQGGTNDGSDPVWGVVFDAHGNLYGATTYGGLTACAIGGECGTVFQLSPPVHKGDPWTEKLIYKFQGQGANDGGVPSGGLILDAAGNLYGVTGYGGSGDCVLLGLRAGCGTVYELSPPQQKGDAWTEAILYSFATAKQGYVPNGDLVFDGAGNLYGATSFGGGKGTTCDEFYGGNCGAVFELSPPKTKGGKWTEKVLHAFAGLRNNQQTGDGAEPNGGLTLGAGGAIYGTTYIGGYNCPHHSNQGCGTAFELGPPSKKGGAWTETVLHRFKGTPDGGGPMSGLVFDVKGSLYGTTLLGGGGNSGSGTVFSLAPNANGSWKERVLYSFQGQSDGAEPKAGLVFDTRGNVYGTASVGGAGETAGGTMFELRPSGRSWLFAVLHTFTGNPDGSWPTSSLIFDVAGNLYGTTEESGTGQGCGNYGCGTVFEVSP